MREPVLSPRPICLSSSPPHPSNTTSCPLRSTSLHPFGKYVIRTAVGFAGMPLGRCLTPDVAGSTFPISRCTPSTTSRRCMQAAATSSQEAVCPLSYLILYRSSLVDSQVWIKLGT